MEFIIHSTLSTLAVIGVIIVWLSLGFLGVRLWIALFSKPPVIYNWPTRFAIAGGALTFGIAVLWGMARGLRSDDDEF